MRLLYTATIFLNSFLLFLVQPLIAKRLLPIFGGSPLVWNTCLLFFQMVLLLGYLWAHLSFKWFGEKRQPWIHLAVVFIPILLLPIGLPLGLRHLYEGSLGDPHSWAAQPALMLLLMLFASVGLPFFALSGGAPVVQRWFSHTKDPRAHDPYFLYQASNLGSMIALLGYPLWFERTFGLVDQSKWWSLGYAGLLIVLATSAFALLRKGQTVEEEAPASADDSPAPTWAERLTWMFLSAGPSALLLAVTAFMSTNVAPIPLLWVLPLALYLITFIIAFASKPVFPPRITRYLAPVAFFPALVPMLIDKTLPVAIMAPLQLVAFFFVALGCHNEIGRTRPKASRLTEFYLWISVGGVVGGFFSSIVAPLAFTSLAEYPIAAVACFAAIGLSLKPKRAIIGDLAIPVAGAIVTGVLASHYYGTNNEMVWAYAVLATLMVSALRPIRFALALAAIYIGMHFGYPELPKLYAERSFFGFHYVDSTGEMHRLMNGTTLHGTQWTDPAKRRIPTTYYSHRSGIGRALLKMQQLGTLHSYAVVGLGTGTLAAYGQAGERLDYYEIDPGIERIARNPKYFTYLTDCPAQVHVILGDARLRMNEAPAGGYDLIALDAFASDAIPVHLLTEEAIRLYMSKLSPNGVLAVHVSNRYLRLAPVVAAIGQDLGLKSIIDEDLSDAEFRRDGRYALGETLSSWILVGRGDSLKPFDDPAWQILEPTPGIRAWTDDYSNVLSVMIFVGRRF